jgi:hypothetical protein
VGDASVDGDARSVIVGRWLSCGASFDPLPNDGVEFGANGRWHLLEKDASGALVPLPSPSPYAHGYYYALGSGQLDVNMDVSDADASTGGRILSVRLGVGGDALMLGDSPMNVSSVYARVDPSPLDGADNPPSTSDGTCSMVGTWDVPASASAPAATFSFDEVGNFVGGPAGSDLCASHTMYGTYWLSAGVFELTTNVGMGQCQWWFGTGFRTQFDSSCRQLTLMQVWDNCTGGRGYLNGGATLTKRP